jgi:methyl-accepting chemotaxis protein
MTAGEIKKKISNDECDGEKLISKFRIALALIFSISLSVISIIRNMEGYGYIPWRAHIFTTVFLLYAAFLFFYLRKKETLHDTLKYIFVTLDMTIISACIWLTCTYPEVCPPIIYLAILAQFYIMLILLGSFRYSIP